MRNDSKSNTKIMMIIVNSDIYVNIKDNISNSIGGYRTTNIIMLLSL